MIFMKISYNWLKEYVDINADVQDFAKKLTMSGSEVKAIHDLGSDKIIEFEITSNRPDCLSIIGIARETAAVFGKRLKLPKRDIPKRLVREGYRKLECVIENEKLCPRYTARVISDVRVKKSGEETEKILALLGFRPVNNVVDITNFCLIEQGQPLHAFDLDKIKGAKIIVREAADGEKIVTLDGVERELSRGMLVISDEEKAIAIAGIMGARNTEVTENTRNVLLESAYFDPVSIRKTVSGLALSSESSYRFERGVFCGQIRELSDRAAKLIAFKTGGKICEFYDKGKLLPCGVTINFVPEKVKKILGVSPTKGKITNILTKLGIKVSKGKKNNLIARVPGFRRDLKRDIDLIEEIARIYGYDKIPETIVRLMPLIKRKETERRVIEKLRESLAASGLNEIMSYSLISGSAAEKFPCFSKNLVMLQNPLSEEQKVLCPQILDGMMKTISRNISRKNKDLGFFEIGKRYSRAENKKEFLETPVLCAALTGALRRNWREGIRKAGIYDLKGIIENAFDRLKIKTRVCSTSVEKMVNCAEIYLVAADKNIGFLGQAGADILKDYDIPEAVYVAHIDLDEVIKKADLKIYYSALSRFPVSVRDVSILCEKLLDAGTIRETILGMQEKVIREVELIDVYEGDKIAQDKKGLTYSIKYGLDTRTLTENEAEETHSRVKRLLSEKFNITFR